MSVWNSNHRHLVPSGLLHTHGDAVSARAPYCHGGLNGVQRGGPIPHTATNSEVDQHLQNALQGQGRTPSGVRCAKRAREIQCELSGIREQFERSAYY